MTQGRPPLWNAFAKSSPGVWTEVAAITGKDRVTLSVAGRSAVNWLQPAPPGGLLAKLKPDGSAELVPWQQLGEGIVKAHLERLEPMKEPQRGTLALALMDNLMRVQVEGAGRITLPANLRSFLDVERQRVVRFVVQHQRLWIWNEEQWQVQRPGRYNLISEV